MNRGHLIQSGLAIPRTRFRPIDSFQGAIRTPGVIHAAIPMACRSPNPWPFRRTSGNGQWTNNTSLVLAFGLTGTDPEKILLFVGDAQVGNWLSWQELSWPGAGPDGTVLTGKDLLRQTVFYKVGHHGSSNATLSEKGLEQMNSPELVAMIPVDQEWAAARRPKPWPHPEEPVVRRLLEKTNGRVIRSDVIPPKRPEGFGESLWKKFLEDVEYDTGPDRLWIQYTIRQPG